MSSQILIRLEGEFLPVATFEHATEKFRELLVALDQDLSGETTIEWGVASLENGSATLVVEPRFLSPGFEGNYHEMVALLMVGLSILRERAERPANFSDTVLRKLRELAVIRRNRLSSLSIGRRQTNTQDVVELEESLVAHIDVLLNRHVSVGSVEGVLKALSSVSANAYFTIRESVYDSTVRCYCDESKLLELAASFNRRIMVSGRIETDATGKPSSIRVTDTRVFPPNSELVSVKEIVGVYTPKNG